MYMPSPAHRRLLMILLVAGLGGFFGLMAWAAHTPHQADVIRFFAIVWLLVFGAARILVHLDEALGQPGEAATHHWARLRGRGDR
jgi:hypothetical protein